VGKRTGGKEKRRCVNRVSRSDHVTCHVTNLLTSGRQLGQTPQAEAVCPRCLPELSARGLPNIPTPHFFPCAGGALPDLGSWVSRSWEIPFLPITRHPWPPLGALSHQLGPGGCPTVGNHFLPLPPSRMPTRVTLPLPLYTPVLL
jgi:hypothetical protein